MIAEPIPAEQSATTTTTALPSFIVSQSMLQRALLSAQSLVAKKEPIVPILANVLLAVSDNEIRLTGSDLQNRVSVDLPIERGTNAAHFRTTVDFRRFFKLISSLPEQPLTIRYDDTIDRLTVEAYSAEYRFSTDRAVDYPKLASFPPEWKGPGQPEKEFHDVASFAAPASLLRSLLTATLPFCSNDDLRPAMTGVSIKVDGGLLKMAATDGHRLAEVRSHIAATTYQDRCILPYRVGMALLAIMPPDKREETVKVEFSHLMARFTWPSHIVTCRLIDERYPDYEAVLGTSQAACTRSLLLDRRLLLAVLGRVNQFTNLHTHTIRLVLDGNTVAIEANDLDFGVECRERIEISGEPHEGRFEIGYNAKLLIHTLKQIKANQVQFLFDKPNKSALLSPIVDGKPDANSVMLVMPVMLNTYA